MQKRTLKLLSSFKNLSAKIPAKKDNFNFYIPTNLKELKITYYKIQNRASLWRNGLIFGNHSKASKVFVYCLSTQRALITKNYRNQGNLKF